MKSREIRRLSDDQLLDLYEDKKESLFAMRQQYVTGELKDTSSFRKTRREIARLLTIMRERELAAETVAEEGN